MSADATASDLVKAHVQVLDERDAPKYVVPVLFNPEEYHLRKRISYADQRVTGSTTPVTQFVDGDAETLSMELFFDTYEDGTDVRVHTALLDQLVTIDSERHAPPICRFVWGTLVFKAVVERIDKRFTMFGAGGIPVRATVDVTFREYRTPGEDRKLNPFHSADRTTTWRVTEGDTLPAIAAEEYGDPGKWRPIADRNEVENPRELAPGTELVIPPLPR